MFSFIQQLLRRRHLQNYIWKLGSALVKRYGESITYTPDQVSVTVKFLGFSSKDICYGYASFCTLEDFEKVYVFSGGARNYDDIRAEVDKYLSKRHHSLSSNSTDDNYTNYDSGHNI